MRLQVVSCGAARYFIRCGSKRRSFPHLLIGNDTKDDAAVMDLGDGTGIISTTDFFMPIVDDPRTFGRIAAANAISDVYAMGGTPLMAIAILGWPLGKIPEAVASEVVDGGRAICSEAGIPLAGGHSIDSPEPIFGSGRDGPRSAESLEGQCIRKAWRSPVFDQRPWRGICYHRAEERPCRPADLELCRGIHASNLIALVRSWRPLQGCMP